MLLDEAYVDFASENAMSLALKYPHVLVARTFSKAYSLCFQRVGYCVGHPELIAALHKIRDSYNVNGLGPVAACATLDDLPYYRANFREIIATREQLSQELEALGFQVFPSQTNFILVRPPGFSAQTWLRKLRDRRILVRWFSDPSCPQLPAHHHRHAGGRRRAGQSCPEYSLSRFERERTPHVTVESGMLERSRGQELQPIPANRLPASDTLALLVRLPLILTATTMGPNLPPRQIANQQRAPCRQNVSQETQHQFGF